MYKLQFAVDKENSDSRITAAIKYTKKMVLCDCIFELKCTDKEHLTMCEIETDFVAVLFWFAYSLGTTAEKQNNVI